MARFETSVEGSPELTYQWLFEGLPIEGATESMLIVADGSSDKVGAYSAIIRNTFGSVETESAQLSLRPQLDAVSIRSIAVTGGGLVQLELEVSGEGSHLIILEWSRDLENWITIEEREVAAGVIPWQLSTLDGEENVSFRFKAGP